MNASVGPGAEQAGPPPWPRRRGIGRWESGRHAARGSVLLFRIVVPISIATRLLDQLGLIHYLGDALAPVMGLLGLPGSMGLVWGTGMVTNLYGGMVVFASLAPGAGLSAAQVTVLATVMLVAHSLPVELQQLESESMVRVVNIELEDGRVVTVPRANVEIIEE